MQIKTIVRHYTCLKGDQKDKRGRTMAQWWSACCKSLDTQINVEEETQLHAPIHTQL